MRFVALATDYDGTLASQGRVSETAIEALEAFRRSGRSLILVTGRELDELLGIFPRIDVFDRVVAENGALLYCPRSKEHKVLGVPPAPDFVDELVRRGVNPLSVGRSIVATVTPHETTVIAAVRDLGLELQVIFNKGAVMVLPAGVNKATGLAAALAELKLSMRNVVAIGDAENDHAMLRAAEFGVAVANALPSLQQEADYASSKSHADAVVESMEAVVRDDLSMLLPAVPRRRLALGVLADGTAVTLPASGSRVVVTGPNAGGAAEIVLGLARRLVDDGYQCCMIDPQGRLSAMQGLIVLGSMERSASSEEVATALVENPEASIALGALESAAGATLFKTLAQLRQTTGRPHWCFVDACGEQGADLLAQVGEFAALSGDIGIVAWTSSASRAGEIRGDRWFDTLIGVGAHVEEHMQALAGDAMQRGRAPDSDSDGALIWSSSSLHGRAVAFRPLDAHGPRSPDAT